MSILIFDDKSSTYQPLIFTRYPDNTFHVSQENKQTIANIFSLSRNNNTARTQQTVKINFIDSPSSIEEFLVFIQTVKGIYGGDIKRLYYSVGYLPYARDDLDGDNRTRLSSIYLNLFSALGIESRVSILDPHSTLSIEDDDGVKSKILVTVNIHFGEGLTRLETIVPGRGAVARSVRASQLHGNTTMHFCSKIRENNNITTKLCPTLTEALRLHDLVVYDDICDGGATFIGIAKEVHTYNPDTNITVCVTHGIFSKGVWHLLNNGIHEVRFTNSFHQYKDESIISIIKCKLSPSGEVIEEVLTI